MGSLRGQHAYDVIDTYDEIDDIGSLFARNGSRHHREERNRTTQSWSQPLRREQPSEAFKCRRCKAFIGVPLTGGRHRNHCPSCLWSLHVDRKTPGDRASPCRSLMEPVGSLARLNGEQVVVHRCRACGIERHCRVAADDNPLLLMRLPLVAPLANADDEAVEVA